MKIHPGWKAQDLISERDIRMYLDANLKIAKHPVPKEMVGELYCIAGQVSAIYAIMEHIERRAELFKGYTKPHKEEEEEKK